MRWARVAVALAAASLAVAGCGEAKRGEQPDEIGSAKPGDFGEQAQEQREAAQHRAETDARQQEQQVPDRAATGQQPPEGYRSRQEVVGQTGATPGPTEGQLQGGQGAGGAQPGGQVRAGFEQEAQEGAQANQPSSSGAPAQQPTSGAQRHATPQQPPQR